MMNSQTSTIPFNVAKRSFASDCGFEKIYFKNISAGSQDIAKTHVIVLHDLNQHHGYYESMAEYLVGKSSNIEVDLIDLKGHGLSSGTRTHVGSFKEYVYDLIKFINQKEHPEKRYLLGNGLGALVILKMVYEYMDEVEGGVDGIILANPHLRLRRKFPLWVNAFLDNWKDHLAKIRLPLGMRGEELFHSYDLVKKYNSDPLVTNSMTMNLLKEVLDASFKISQSLYFIDVPSLFLLSGKSFFFDPDITKLYVKGIPGSHSSVFSYPRMKYDLFNDMGRDKVFSDIYNWISL